MHIHIIIIIKRNVRSFNRIMIISKLNNKYKQTKQNGSSRHIAFLQSTFVWQKKIDVVMYWWIKVNKLRPTNSNYSVMRHVIFYKSINWQPINGNRNAVIFTLKKMHMKINNEMKTLMIAWYVMIMSEDTCDH